jgi:hypothetical protein
MHQETSRSKQTPQAPIDPEAFYDTASTAGTRLTGVRQSIPPPAAGVKSSYTKVEADVSDIERPFRVWVKPLRNALKTMPFKGLALIRA